jgi:two-component system cell cycle sensor histidine kinase/response regulator CckA
MRGWCLLVIEVRMDDKTNAEPPFVTTLAHAAADPFRLLVEAVKDYGIFMLDPAGNVSSWNPGAEKIQGYKAEDIIGQHFSCFYTAEDVAAGKPQRSLQTALEEGRLEEEGLRLRKGGATFWAIVTITSILDPFGQHIGFANVTRDITERKQAEDLLRASEERFRLLVEGVQDYAIIMLDPAGKVSTWNQAAERLTGYQAKDIIGQHFACLSDADDVTSGSPQRILQQAVAQGRHEEEGWRARHDGSRFWTNVVITALLDASGTLRGFASVSRDLTQFRRAQELENQLRQSQKLEVVGQLAGGVAHDFNNLLTVISGNSELLFAMLPPDDPRREPVKAISEAGERAAGLTRQLLAFSRRAVLETKVLDLNEVVKETEKLLRRMIGEDILLTAVLDPNLSRIKADPNQMGQVLMNLAVNARDALPHGGQLTIETSDSQLDEAYAAQHSDCKPGRYVKLAVSDNGCGMTPEVKTHAFEPFFTTKGPGKGSGLGLSTVYGIVKQSGGSIELYSEPGHGTTIKIYLPAVDEPLQPLAHDQGAAQATGGAETVLLVEDEDAVRAIAVLGLEAQGYTVLPAESGKQALAIIEKHRGRIDLLVTDVVMPGMSGPELAEALCLQYPSLKVLYLSGYTDDSVIRHGILQAEVAFLQKPYTPLSLARKAREVLDKQPSTS